LVVFELWMIRCVAGCSIEEPQAADGAGLGGPARAAAGRTEMYVYVICRFAVASDGTTMELESGPFSELA
jgi:hypothetical protein